MAIQNDGGGRYRNTRPPQRTSTPLSRLGVTKGASPRRATAPAAPQAPAATQTPVAQRQQAPQQYSMSTPGLYSTPLAAPEPVDPYAGMSDDDYLATGADSAYAAQMAALMKALQGYETDITAQRGKYDVDYGSTLKNLGWMKDDPATKDVDESGWNFNDQNTAAGRSFTNQQNDFAGRGLLQSSLYGKATEDLKRSLSDQKGGIDTSRGNFMSDLERQLGAYKNENTLSQQQARAEAIARRAGGISL